VGRRSELPYDRDGTRKEKVYREVVVVYLDIVIRDLILEYRVSRSIMLVQLYRRQ
jgi:hypothetical protein